MEIEIDTMNNVKLEVEESGGEGVRYRVNFYIGMVSNFVLLEITYRVLKLV